MKRALSPTHIAHAASHEQPHKEQEQEEKQPEIPDKTPPSRESFDLDHSDFGLTLEVLGTLALELKVDQKFALAETLSYAALCKLRRSEKVDRSALVEVWDALPEGIKCKDKHNPDSRILILGANPRNPQFPTLATHQLPHTTRLLAAYVLNHVPHMSFLCLSLRLNADKGPHRDLHNGPEPSFLQVLTNSQTGGNLWLADPKGSEEMLVNGSKVYETIVPCHEQPVNFSSKTKLHATQPWTGARRLVLVAWTPITKCPELLTHLQQDFAFPKSRFSQPPQELVQSSLESAFHKAAQPNTEQPVTYPQQRELAFSVSSDTQTTQYDSPRSQPELGTSESPSRKNS